MKSKKLLISIAAVALVIVLVVVMIAVFAVKSVEIRYHNFTGEEIVSTEGSGIVPNDVLSMIKGNSTVFLSKTNLMSRLNANYREWHAFAVVKKFPNVVEVHFVQRTVIAKINLNGEETYIDSFGYVAYPPQDGSGVYVDLTNAIDIRDTRQCEYGSELIFSEARSNVRLKCILEAILATWRCYVEVNEIPQILNVDAFEFDSDNNLLIKPKNGGTIKVISPETNLSNRLIKAYGVYFNKNFNLQSGNWVITVHKNGSITTPGK